MRRAGLEVSGLVTKRTGPHDLTVHELHTGRAYPLTLPFVEAPDRPLMNFRMDPEAMVRSGSAIARGFPADVVVVDELGPLELEHEEGWVEALDDLRDNEYGVGFLVLRPELLWLGIQRLPGSIYTVVSVTLANRERIPVTLARIATAAVGRKQGEKEDVEK